MAFPKENDGHGHDRLFSFWFQTLLPYGGYQQRSTVWILPESETPVRGRSFTSATSAGGHHTRLRHFLRGIAHRRSKKAKKKKAKNSHGLHLSYLYA